MRTPMHRYQYTKLTPEEIGRKLRSTQDGPTSLFPYSIQVGMPIESDTSLAGMARLQGDGVRTWWEGGVYNVTYARDVVDGRWRITRLEYNTLSRADDRPGRSYAKPIPVSPISTRYPEDPQGPDALV